MCAISLGFHGCPLVGFTGVPPPITNPILRKRLGHAPLTGDGTSTNILPLGHFGAPFAYYSAVANFCGIFEPTNVMCVVTCGIWVGKSYERNKQPSDQRPNLQHASFCVYFLDTIYRWIHPFQCSYLCLMSLL